VRWAVTPVHQVLIVDLGSNEEAAHEAATTLGPGLPDADGARRKKWHKSKSGNLV